MASTHLFQAGVTGVLQQIDCAVAFAGSPESFEQAGCAGYFVSAGGGRI